MRQISKAEWVPPDYAACPQCNGCGVYRGMFHSSPCAHCHGTGYAAPDGEALPAADLIAMVSRRRDHWRRAHAQLMKVPGVLQALEQYHAKRQTEIEQQAMGYGQNRYQGD